MLECLIELVNPPKVQKQAIIFKGPYGHRITLSQLFTKAGMLVDIGFDCYGRARSRLAWSAFIEQGKALTTFRDLLYEENYIKFGITNRPVFIPSPMLSLADVYASCGTEFIVLRQDNGVPLLSMQICEDSGFKVILGTADTLQGSLYRISVAEAVGVLDAVIEFAA